MAPQQCEIARGVERNRVGQGLRRPEVLAPGPAALRRGFDAHALQGTPPRAASRAAHRESAGLGRPVDLQHGAAEQAFCLGGQRRGQRHRGRDDGAAVRNVVTRLDQRAQVQRGGDPDGALDAALDGGTHVGRQQGPAIEHRHADHQGQHHRSLEAEHVLWRHAADDGSKRRGAAIDRRLQPPGQHQRPHGQLLQGLQLRLGCAGTAGGEQLDQRRVPVG